MKRMMLSLLVSLGFAPLAWGADQYTIDAAHSRVGFSVSHLMISRVQGEFQNVAGTIMYDEQNIGNSSVNVTIQADSIDTNVEDRDTHLRSPDFLDAATYSTITFQSTRIDKQADGSVLLGTLNLHGVEKEIAIAFKIIGTIQDPWGKTRLGLEGQTQINRQDFGVKWNKAMDNGGMVVGDDVEIHVMIEAVLQSTTQPAAPATP